MMLPQKDEKVVIINRRCSDKVQPHIKVGMEFLVREVTSTKKGVTVLVVSPLKSSGVTYRINAERFHWAVFDEVKVVKKQADAKKAAAAQKMLEIALQNKKEKESEEWDKKFTFEENAKMAYVPLLIYDIAWRYTMAAVQCAADHRIDILKKLSRTVKDIKMRYEKNIFRSLDAQHIRHIKRQAQAFMEENQLNFQQLYLTTQNSINHQYQGVEHDDLRTNAFLASIFVRLLHEYENDMTAIIRKRIKGAVEEHLPEQDALLACLDAYIGTYNFTVSQSMEDGLKIFSKQIDAIEYTMID